MEAPGNNVSRFEKGHGRPFMPAGYGAAWTFHEVISDQFPIKMKLFFLIYFEVVVAFYF